MRHKLLKPEHSVETIKIDVSKSVWQTIRREIKNMHFNQIRIKISFTLTSPLTLISEILDQGAEISYQFCLRIARPHSFVYICVSKCAHCVAL